MLTEVYKELQPQFARSLLTYVDMSILQRTLKQRLEEAMKLAGVDQSDLVELTGLSRAAVSKWCTGATVEIKAQFLFKIARRLKCDPEWLATGDGDRLEGHTPDPRLSDISDERIQLMHRYARLPKPIRHALDELIQSISNSNALVDVIAEVTFKPPSEAVHAMRDKGVLPRGTVTENQRTTMRVARRIKK